MIRIVFGFVFIVAYIAWVVYHALAKRDIRRHLGDLYALTFFTTVWVAIYLFMYFDIAK